MSSAPDLQAPRHVRRVGVLAALPGELGPLRTEARVRRDRNGHPLFETPIDGVEAHVVSVLSGVGKVAAAGAAAALLAEGVDVLLVVGTCGAIRRGEEVGDLVHAQVAIQWDLAVREGREMHPDSSLREAWNRVVPSAPAAFLTADRPAIRAVERVRRSRAMRGFAEGTVVAEMETAAAAAVAQRAGVPWAALRVVSDRRLRGTDLIRPSARRAASFAEGYRLHAGRPAASIPDLCRRLAAR